MVKLNVKPKTGRSKTVLSEDGTANRESYLIQAVEILRPLFTESGYAVPAHRVSVGWPGSRRGKRALGSCWKKEASKDGSFQIFISPMIDDAAQALAVLVHEICHAVTDCDGHSPAFGAVARAVGLEGKLTATYAGSALTKRLHAVVELLGPYPHAALDPTESGEKVQTTRMVKCICPESGYAVRTTRMWIEKHGLPYSPVNPKLRMIQAT